MAARPEILTAAHGVVQMHNYRGSILFQGCAKTKSLREIQNGPRSAAFHSAPESQLNWLDLSLPYITTTGFPIHNDVPIAWIARKTSTGQIGVTNIVFIFTSVQQYTGVLSHICRQLTIIKITNTNDFHTPIGQNVCWSDIGKHFTIINNYI